MNLALVQQLAPNGLAGAPFEENVVRNDDCRPAVLLQQRFYVLEEVELFVGSRSPKVVAFYDFCLTRHFAVIRHNRRAAFLAEGRICHHDLITIAGISS